MVTPKTKTMWALWLKTSARGTWHVGAALHESEAAARALFDAMPGYCEAEGDVKGAAEWREAKCIPVPVEIPIPEEVRNDDR